ncbi:MAG TPA: hypothetical protein VF181_05105 [Balneolaceae bacterium]
METYKKIIWALCTALLLVTVAGTSYAQEGNSGLVQRAQELGVESALLAELQSGLEAENISEQHFRKIVGTAIAMSEQSLPANMVIQKALEGISKGISGDRIIPVVNHIQQSVVKSAGVIDEWMGRPEIQQMINRTEGGMAQDEFRTKMTKVTSKSIIRNVSPEAVSNILSQISDQSLLAIATPKDIIVAMGILPALPNASSQPDASGKLIVRALKGGFGADELQRLPAALRAAQMRSQLPAASVIEGVARQMEGNIPAKQILQNLFNGNIGGGPPGNIPGLGNIPDRGNKSGQK